MSPQEANDRIALFDLIYLAKLLIRKTPDMTTIIGKSYVSKIENFVLEIDSELRDDKRPKIMDKLPPRFANVYCSQCGADFGPGDHGYSHCEKHRGRR